MLKVDHIVHVAVIFSYFASIAQGQNLYGSPMWGGGYYGGGGGRGYGGVGMGGFGGMSLAPGGPGAMANINGQQYPYIDPQTYWLIAGADGTNPSPKHFLLISSCLTVLLYCNVS